MTGKLSRADRQKVAGAFRAAKHYLWEGVDLSDRGDSDG